jgi:hypothetical protein
MAADAFTAPRSAATASGGGEPLGQPEVSGGPLEVGALEGEEQDAEDRDDPEDQAQRRLRIGSRLSPGFKPGTVAADRPAC